LLLGIEKCKAVELVFDTMERKNLRECMG